MSESIVLEKLGLTPNESLVYRHLLASQVLQTAQELILALSIDKVSVYRALKSLEQQNLINVTGEARNHKYRVSPTKNLLDKYNSKVHELSSLRDQLEDLVNSAANEQSEHYQRHNIQVYKGLEGYKTWNAERLKRGGSLNREFGSRKFLGELFGDDNARRKYMLGYITARVKKGIYLRSLTMLPAELEDFDKTDPALLKEKRLIKLSEELVLIMSVFGDSFGFYTKQGGEYLGVIISDPLLAKMIATVFDALWEQGEKA